jgi:hypothetical protein
VGARKYNKHTSMWVIALEALVALTLLIVIVWMTLGSAHRRETPPDASSPSRDAKPPQDPPSPSG